MWFQKKQSIPSVHDRHQDFSYLSSDAYYFDSACQSMRPQPVLDAVMEYYTTYNACGGRVQYAWGKQVDSMVDRVRDQAIHFIGQNTHAYVTSFTLNTTYGINLLLHQLPQQDFSSIWMSDREHNSVYVPAHGWKERTGKPGGLLGRDEHGVVDYRPIEKVEKPLVLLQMTSNVDGVTVCNAQAIADVVHRQGGVLIVDAAQTWGHHREALASVNFDACITSAHKMYGPSLGVLVVLKQLLERIQPLWTGGGTVLSVSGSQVEFAQDVTLLEPGLQDWAAIAGFGAAMQWMEDTKGLVEREQVLATHLYEGIRELPGVHMISPRPTSIVTFWVEGQDSHRLAMYLSRKEVMVRSGYFCCHDYLQHQQGYPPLLRFSLGAHNTMGDVEQSLAYLRLLLHS